MNRKTPTLTRAFVSVLHAKTSSAISAQLFVLWLLFSVLSFVVGQNSSATASPTKSDSYFAVSSGFPSVGSSVISSKSTENVTSTSTPSPNPPVNKTSIVSIIQSSNFAVVGSTEPITLALSFTSTPNSTRTTSGSESVQSLLDASTLSIAGSSEPLTLAVFTSSSLSDNSNSSSAVNSSSVLNNQGILSSSSRSSSSNSVNLVNSTGDASSQAESTSIGETVSTSRTVKLASKETATRLLISSSDVSSSSTLPKTNTSEFGTNVPASTLPQVPSRSRASTGAVNQSGTHQPSTQIPSISFGQSMTSEVESQYYGMSTQEIFPHSTTSQTVSWSRFHTAVESSSSRQTRHYAITSVVSESIATSWPTQGSNKPLASSAKVLSTTIIALSSLRQGSEASSRNQIAGGTASSYLSTLKLTTGLASVLGSESSAVSGLNLSTSLFIRNDSLSSTNVFSSSHFFLSSGSIASHYSGSAANLTQGPRSKIADATHALSVTLKQQTTNQGSFDVSERSSSMKSDSRGATISSTSLQGNQSSVVTENSLTPSTSSSDKSSYVLSTFGSPIKATSSPFMYTDLDSSVVESTSKSPVSTMFLSPSSRPSLAHISPIMQLPFSKESLALSHSSLENSTTMSESISGVFHSRNRTSSPTSAPTSPATTLTSVLSPLLSSHFQSSGIVLGDQSTRLYQSSSIFTVGSSITGYPTQSLRTSAFIDHSLSVGNTTTVSEVSITGNMSSLGHQTVNRTSSKKTLLTGGYLSSRPSTSSTDDLFSEISAKSFASSYLSQSGFTVSTITRDLATAFVTSSESHPTDSFPTMSKSIIKSSLQSADQTLTTSSLTLQSSRLNKTSFSTRKEQSAQPTIRSTVALQTTTEASSEIVFPAQTTSEFNTSSIPAKVSSFATVPSSSPMVSQSHNLSSFLGEITSSLPSKAIENKTVNPGSGGLNVTSLLSYRPSVINASTSSYALLSQLSGMITAQWSSSDHDLASTKPISLALSLSTSLVVRAFTSTFVQNSKYLTLKIITSSESKNLHDRSVHSYETVKTAVSIFPNQSTSNGADIPTSLRDEVLTTIAARNSVSYTNSLEKTKKYIQVTSILSTNSQHSPLSVIPSSLYTINQINRSATLIVKGFTASYSIPSRVSTHSNHASSNSKHLASGVESLSSSMTAVPTSIEAENATLTNGELTQNVTSVYTSESTQPFKNISVSSPLQDSHTGSAELTSTLIKVTVTLKTVLLRATLLTSSETRSLSVLSKMVAPYISNSVDTSRVLESSPNVQPNRSSSPTVLVPLTFSERRVKTIATGFLSIKPSQSHFLLSSTMSQFLSSLGHSMTPVIMIPETTASGNLFTSLKSEHFSVNVSTKFVRSSSASSASSFAALPSEWISIEENLNYSSTRVKLFPASSSQRINELSSARVLSPILNRPSFSVGKMQSDDQITGNPTKPIVTTSADHSIMTVRSQVASLGSSISMKTAAITVTSSRSTDTLVSFRSVFPTPRHSAEFSLHTPEVSLAVDVYCSSCSPATSIIVHNRTSLGTSSRSSKSRTPVASVLTQTSLPTSNVFFSVVSDKATSHRSSQKHTPLSSSSVKSSIVAITGVSTSLVTPTLPLNQSTEPLDSFSLVFGSPSSLINATLLFMQSMSFTSFPKRTELSPPSTSVATNQPPSLITRSEKPSQPTYKDQSSRISSGFSSLLATIQSVSSVNATVFRSLVTSTEEFRQHTLNASSLQSSSSIFSSLLVTSTGRMETVVRSTAANKSSLQITGPVLKTFDHTFSASTESGASTSVLYTASTQSQVTSRISQSLEAVSNQSSMPMLNSSSTEFKPTTLFSLNTSATVREMSATYIMGFSSTNDRSSLESTILPSFQTLSHQSFAKSSLGSLSISAVLDMTQSAKSLLSASTTAHDLSSGSFMSSNISARGTVATTVLSARVKSSLSSLLSNPNTMTYLTLLVASTSVETRSSLSSSSTFSTQGTRSLSRFWTLDSLSSIFTRKTSALQRSSPVSQPRSLSPLSPSALHSMSVSSTEFSDSFSSSGISTNESETSTLFPTFTSPHMTHSLPLSPNTSIQPSFQVSLVYLSSVLPTASLVDATVFTPLIPSKLESDASLSSAVTSNATSSIAASFQTSKVPSQSSITGAVVTPSISAYGTNLTTVITSIISSSRLNRTSVFTETRSPVNASASLRGSSFALKQSTDGHMLSLPSLGTSALRSSRRTSSLTASSFFYVSLSKDLIVSSSVIKASLFSPGSSNSSMVPSFSSSSPSVLATTNQTTRLVNSESLLVTINSSTLESLQSIRVTDTRITLRPTDKTSTLPSSPFYSQSAEQNSSSTVERPSFTLQRSSPIPSVGKTVDSSVAFTLNSSHSPASVSSSSTSRSRSSVNSTSVYRLSTGLPESSPPLSLTLNVSTAILSNMTSMTPSSTLPHKRTEFATPLSAVYESVSRTTNATLESSKSLYFSVTSDSQRTLTPLTKTSVYYSVSASRMYNVSITLLASFNTTISSLLKSTSSGLPETISFIITNVSMTRSRTSLSVLSSVASSLISAANVSRSVSQNPTDEVSSSTPLNVTPPASVTRVPESYGSILSSIINTSSTTGVSSTPGFPPRPTPSTTSRDFVSQSLDATRNITATSVMESTSQMTSGVLQSSLTISLTKRSSFATESIASSNLEGSHIPVTRTLATPVSVSNIPVISSLASSSIQLSPSIGTVAKSSAITGTQDLTRTFDLYSSLATNVSSIPDSSSFVPVLSSPLSEESSRLPPLPTGATVGSSRKTNLLSETRRLFSLTLSRDSKSSVALRTDSTRPYNPSSLTIKTSEKQSQSSFLLSSTIPIATSVSTKLQTFSTNMTIPAGQSSGRDATIQTVLASSQTIVADETSSVLDRSRLVSTSVTIKTLSGALTLSILSSFVISSKQAMIKSSSFTIAMPSSIWPRKSSVEPSSMSKRSGVPSVDLPSVKTTTLFSESKSITLSLSQAVMTSSSLSVGFPLSPPTRSSQVTSSSQEKGSKVVVTLIDLSSVKTKTSISNIMRTSMLTSKSSTSSHIVMTSSSFPIVLSSSIGPVSSLIGTSSLDKSPGVVVTEVELSSVKTKTPITRSTSSTAVIASETYASSQVVKKSSSFIIGLSSSVRPKSSSTRISSLDKTLGVGVTSVHVSSAKTERLTVGTTKTNVVITTKTPSSSEVASSHLSTTQLLSLTLSEAKSILTSTKAVATSSPKRSASSTNPSASVSNSVVTPTAQSGEGIVGIQILVPISENEMNDSFRIVLEERLAAAYRQGLEKGDSRKRRDLGWIVQEFFGPDPTSFTTKDFRRWKKTAAYKVYERQNKRFRRQTDNIFAVINTIRRARPIVGEEVVDVYYRIFDGPDMLSAETVVETTNRLTEAELVVALKYGVILRPYVVKEIEVTPNPGRTTTPASLILTIVVPTVAVLFLLFALLWIKFAAKRKKKKTKVKPEKKRRNLGIQVVHENDVFPPKMPTVIYANPRRKHSSTSSTSSTSSEDLPSKLPVPPLPDYPQTPTQEKPSQQYRRRTTGPPQKKLANDKTIERDARGKSHRNVEYSVPTKKPARVAEKIEMKNLAGVVENRPQMREEKLAYNYPRDEMSVRFTALPPLVETSLVGPRPNNEVNGEEEKSPRERIILDSGVPQAWLAKMRMIELQSIVAANEAQLNEDDESLNLKANVERWRNKMRHREKLRQELREKERERDKKLRKLEKDDKEITYNQNAKASSLDSLQRSLTAERKRRSRLERWRNNRVGTSSSKSSSGSNSSSSSSSESELEDGKRKKTKQYRERKDKESRTKPGNSQNVISGRGADEARKEAAWTIRETPGVRLVSVRPRDEDTESRHSPASEPVYPPNGVSGHKIRQPRPVRIHNKSGPHKSIRINVSSRSQQRDRVHYLLERAFPVMPVMPRHVHTSTDQYYPDDGLYEDLEELDPNVPQYDEDLFMENETFRSGYPTRRKQAFGGPVLYDDDHIYEEPTLAPVSLPQTRFVSPEEYQGRFLVPTQYARAYGGVPHPNRGRPPSAARRPGSARPARSARSARPSSAETEPMARYAPPPAGSVPYSRNANPPSEPNARQMFSNRPTVATAPQPSIGTSPRSMVDPERRENLPNSFDGARANLSRAKDNVDHFERDSTAGFPSATARSATAEPRYARPHKSRGSEPTVRLTQTPSSQRQLPAPNTNSRLEMAAMERAELEAQLLVSRALARARTNEWRSNTQSTTTVAKKNLADKTRKESRTENENKKHRRKQSVDSSSSSSSSSTGSSSINDTNKKKKKSDKEKKKTRNAMSARKAVIRPLPAPNMKPHYGKNKPTS